MGNNIFDNGKNKAIFEINFLDRKIYQYCSRVYQKMQNSNIWRGMFSKKSYFCLYFHEKIRILDFLDYNGASMAGNYVVYPYHGTCLTGWVKVCTCKSNTSEQEEERVYIKI